MATKAKQFTKEETVQISAMLARRLLFGNSHSLSSLPQSLRSLNGPTNAYGGRRDIENACGYIANPTVDDYVAAYMSQDIATRVVETYPDYTWRKPPQIVEKIGGKQTRFEKAVLNLIDETDLFNHLRDLDIMAGIGEFAILVMGVDDGGKLHTPLQEKTYGTSSTARKILYMRAYMQKEVEIETYDNDSTSPRYGQPVMYKITPYDFSKGDTRVVGTTPTGTTIQVHFTRVLHFADNALNSEVFGIPRLRRVFNRLSDILKIVGGSAEMFWRGAYQGFSFEADADAEMTPEARIDAKKQIEDYIQGLDRKLLLQGIKTNPLAPAIVSPKDHLDVQLTMVSIASGLPKRILSGSEMGKLSSTQDAQNWADRVITRQNNVATPKILKRFLRWGYQYGILPRPSSTATIYWLPLIETEVRAQADSAYTFTKALREYVSGVLYNAIPFKTYLISVWKYSVEDAEELGKEFDVEKLEKIRKEAIAEAKAAKTAAKKEPDPTKTGRKGERD